MLCEFHIDLLKYKVHICNLEANLRITRKALFQKAHHQHFWLHKRLYQMIKTNIKLSSVQFSCSVVSDSLKPHGLHHARPPCPSPTPGVYWNSCPLMEIGDAIQPSHPLSSPSPPTFNLSQHQGLFKWVSSSHQVTKVLEFQLQQQSFQRIFRTDFL